MELKSGSESFCILFNFVVAISLDTLDEKRMII